MILNRSNSITPFLIKLADFMETIAGQINAVSTFVSFDLHKLQQTTTTRANTS